MARLLLGEGSDWDFRIVGPDQGDLEELRAFIELHSLSENIHYEGPLPLDQVRSRLQAASVFVLPSINEPFPVTVLDALATQTPIVMTDSSGISPILRRLSAATVTDGSPASLARAVRELIEDEKLRDAHAAAGLSAIRTELGISAVVDRLENYYRDALERAREPHRNRKGG
jgi:glycosyltransferase involved in cell wall biosynthesis